MTDTEKPYYMYVLLTEKDTLYCGYTDDVEKRFQKHKLGLGAKYTKSHKPVKVLFSKQYLTKSLAMKAEKKFKSLDKKKKLLVIDGYLKLEGL